MKKTLQTIKKTTLFSAFFAASILNAQTTYTFTNASAIGNTGPTTPQITAAYLSTNLNGSVTVTSGIQQFTVPVSGLYKIEAWGATAGTARAGIDGQGRKISGQITLTAGTVLNIAVGQKGLVTTQGGTNWKSGGGGASWVYTGSTPLMVAGGGGGAGEASASSDAPYNTTSYSGFSYFSGAVQNNTVVGTGGQAGISLGVSGLLYATGAGGGGWLSDGAESSINRQALYNNRGRGKANNFLGGTASNFNADGGFGGGAAGVDNTGAGGGGGGYTGGPGGEGYSSTHWGSGGGGSSFWSGSFSGVVDLGLNPNDGKVIMTLLYSVSITQTSTIACNGLLTAALSASVSGGTGPYTYSWSPTGGTASTATGLGAGTYTCKVTSAVSGTTSSVFTVTQPSAVVSAVASKTNVSCYGGANGVITLTTTGGTAPYSYSWTPTGGSAATASGLVAGTYSCTVKDANLCSVSISTTITQPATFSVATSNSIICVGSTASLTATGATSYTWNTAATTSVIAVSPTVTTTYTVTGVTGVCSNSLTITQNVSTCTNINEVLGNLVTIYPNPNNGVFTIELNATTQVTITTILGDVLLNTTLNTGKQTLDIQNKANGIYFVKLIQNGKQQIIKLIKE